jgi:transcriptional regulator with XRE-family HTH domain
MGWTKKEHVWFHTSLELPSILQNERSDSASKGDFHMDIGHRLRSVREEKKLSQGDIEQRSGLLRCYISRVENGHTVPAIETLEKMARALEMPLYQLMYDGHEPPATPLNGNGKRSDEWGSAGKNARFLNKLCLSLAKMSEGDREVLLSFAEQMPNRRKKSTPKA